MTDLLADLDLARAAARAAGDVVMQWFGSRMDVHFKAPGQPLTEADLAADRVLRQRLTATRPAYGWLSEESIDSPDRLGRTRVWIVDPIDGTRSFIAGRPEFTISIGLAEEGRVVAGVVYNPATGELFSAVRGAGATLEVPETEAVRLRVGSGVAPRGTGEVPGGRGTSRQVAGATSPLTLLASRTEIGAGEFAAFNAGWNVEPVGSTAYKLARVAAGRGDVFLSRGPKSEWDICAGVLLVREAGGRATDLRGEEPRFNGPDPYVHGIAAANPELHEVVMEQLQMLPRAGRLRPGEDG